MSDDRPVTYACEADREKDERRRYVMNVKYEIKMFLHAAFWRTLWAFRIARPYSVAMCKLGWYRKFPGGRCMWCGIVHGRKP